MHERDLSSNIPTQHYFMGERRLQKNYTVIYSQTTFGGKNLFHYLCLYIYNIQILYRFFTIISLDKTSRYCALTIKKSESPKVNDSYIALMYFRDPLPYIPGSYHKTTTFVIENNVSPPKYLINIARQQNQVSQNNNYTLYGECPALFCLKICIAP